MVQQNVASPRLHIGDTVTTLITHLDHVRICALGQVFNLSLCGCIQLGICSQVNLGKNNYQWLCLEQRLYVLEQRDLLLNRVTARF